MDSWYRNQHESGELLDFTSSRSRDQWLLPAAAAGIVLFWAAAAWFVAGVMSALG